MLRTRPTSWKRRRALWIIAAAALGLALLDLLLFVTRDTWRRFDPHDYRDRLAACQAGRWDAVLIGGSPVSEVIDPRLLEGVAWRGAPLERAFNLGLPGGTTMEAYHALKHGPTSPPRLVIYGITASDLNDERNIAPGPRELMTLTDVIDCWRLRPQAGDFVTRHYLRGRLHAAWQLRDQRRGIQLWLASQFPEWAPRAAREAEVHRQLHDGIFENNGFAPRAPLRRQQLAAIPPGERSKLPFLFLENYACAGQLRYLERIMAWTKASGVDLVLLEMPVPSVLDEVRHPDAFSHFRHIIAETAARHHVPLLHADRAAVGLTDADFSDLIHLNETGTRRLTMWLREQLDKGLVFSARMAPRGR